MPDEIPNENPTPASRRHSVSERTTAKFFEEVEILLAEIKRLKNEYLPPNGIAAVTHIETQLEATLALRTAHQDLTAGEETERNNRQNVYQPLNSMTTATTQYVKSAGRPANEVAALRSLGNEIKGIRASPTGGNSISSANTSYASKADKFALFIEQYESLNLPTTEAEFTVETHRNLLAALRASNTAVINSQTAELGARNAFDKKTYTDADSLRNSCLAAKFYLKAKKNLKSSYDIVSKFRFEMPSRLR